MVIKTQKEIEKKYEELNQRMSEISPTVTDIAELANIVKNKSKGTDLEMLTKVMEKSSNTISIDAQRYILEWVMGQHG